MRLRSLAEPLDGRLAAVWPRETKFEKRSFELLREAYIKARYSRHYRITPQELAWLGERVGVLEAVVREFCSDGWRSWRGERPLNSANARHPRWDGVGRHGLIVSSNTQAVAQL